MEAMELACRKNKVRAGNEVDCLVRKHAHARAVDDAPHPHRRMGVRRLPDAWWNIQIIQAWVAFDRRGEEKRVRTPIDIFEPPLHFNRPTPHGQPPISPPNAYETRQTGQLSGARRREEHAFPKVVNKGKAGGLGGPGINISESRVALGHAHVPS